MPTTMTVKGQVTIPKFVRDRLGLKRGALIDFSENGTGEIVMRQVGTRDDAGSLRVAAFDAALARTRSRPIQLGKTVDEWMAEIREPVPL